jgi:hypothetical protein
MSTKHPFRNQNFRLSKPSKVMATMAAIASYGKNGGSKVTFASVKNMLIDAEVTEIQARISMKKEKIST